MFPSSAEPTREELLPSVRRLLASLGEPGPAVPFEDGSLPVYAVGARLVLKLYPPADLDELATERTLLEVLYGRLPIPTPGVVHAGIRDGWGYLVMERLAGRSLKEVWPELSTADRKALAPRLGEAVAALHAVRDPALATVKPDSWDAFLAAQRSTVLDRQRRLDEHWRSQIPAFLDSVDLGRPPAVPLHTEIMRDHLMVARSGDGWQFTGLFDFEPAMRGAAEYDFAAVGLFVSGGDRAFFRELLFGYGYRPDELGREFSRRCLAYALLHVYSDFASYLKILPAPAEPAFDSLADAWWGV